MLTLKNFIKIKEFILKKGQRQPYGSKFNDNPCFDFKDFQVYLNPDVKSNTQNINSNPKLSDFNEMVIKDENKENIYFMIQLNDKLISYDSKHKTKLNNYFKKILSFIKHFS